jgi:hypothetical protein
MALTVGAVGHALTHVQSVPTPSAALYGTMVVAAIAQETTSLSPQDYQNMNFTDMRTDHWSHAKGYDCKSSLSMNRLLADIQQQRPET